MKQTQSSFKKIFIAVKGYPRIGKTPTIKFVRELLKSPECMPSLSEDDRSDFEEIVIFQGKKIGLASAGDNTTEQDKAWDRLFRESCDIVVGTCHNIKNTPANLINRAIENGFEIIWFTPFHSLDESKNNNPLKWLCSARAIVDMIKTVITSNDKF